MRRRAIVVNRASSAEAQLDQWTGQHPCDGGRVFGVDERPQPGDRVTDLGTPEKGGWAREVEGDATLLQRRLDRATAPRRLIDQDADRRRRGAAGEKPLDLARHRLGLCPLVAAAPEAHRRLPVAMLEGDYLAIPGR